MLTDRAGAPRSPPPARWIDYQLPRTSNIRRVFVDGDGAAWVGSVHDAAIIKVEPLD